MSSTNHYSRYDQGWLVKKYFECDGNTPIMNVLESRDSISFLVSSNQVIDLRYHSPTREKPRAY